MWITVLQFIVAIVLWVIARKICENFPFDFMEKKDLKPYDYFDFYSTVYMLVFFIIILIF